MRFASSFLILSLALAGCNREEEPPAASENGAPAEAAITVFAGAGRDRLCIRQEQDGPAGFVTYAASSDNNCLVRGTYDRKGGAIVPNGDPMCRVPVELEGASARLGEAGPGCDYYCGPNASFAAKGFTSAPPGAEAEDIAGDPLC